MTAWTPPAQKLYKLVQTLSGQTTVVASGLTYQQAAQQAAQEEYAQIQRKAAGLPVATFQIVAE